MSMPRIALALSHISEELIAEANEYKPKNKAARTGFAALAACVCIAGIGAIALSRSFDNKLPDTPIDDHGEVTTVSTGSTVTSDSTTVSVTEESVSSVTTEATTSATTVTEEDKPIGGEDSLNRRYVDEAYGIYCCIEIVGNEKVDEWVNGVYLNDYCKQEFRLPDLYLAVRDLGITKDMLLDYNEKCLEKNPQSKMAIPEYVIDALYLENERDVVKALASPLACYYGGRVYSFYEMASGEADVPERILAEYISEHKELFIEHFGEEAFEEKFGNISSETDMETFGGEFVKMLFRAFDLNEPYDFGEFTDILLFEKYMNCLIEQKWHNKSVYGATSNYSTHNITVTATESEKLEDCYKLTYSVNVQLGFPGTEFSSSYGEGVYLLITEKDGKYQVASFQYTVKDPYFTGGGWHSDWGGRGYVNNDPNYWVTADEQEMLDWFKANREAAEANAEKQRQAQAEADERANNPIKLEDGVDNEEILQVIDSYNLYLCYAQNDDYVRLDTSDKYTHESVNYFRVTTKEIDEWSELQALIDSVFYPYGIKTLTVDGVFMNVDGVTYRRFTGSNKLNTSQRYLISYDDDGNGNAIVWIYQNVAGSSKKERTTYYMHYEEDLGWKLNDISCTVQ